MKVSVKVHWDKTAKTMIQLLIIGYILAVWHIYTR